MKRIQTIEKIKKIKRYKKSKKYFKNLFKKIQKRSKNPKKIQNSSKNPKKKSKSEKYFFLCTEFFLPKKTKQKCYFLWPELSSPPCIRIKGGGVPWALQSLDGQKSEILVSNIGFLPVMGKMSQNPFWFLLILQKKSAKKTWYGSFKNSVPKNTTMSWKW